MKTVYCYDLEGNYIREFSSITEATEFTNAKQPNISIALNNHHKQCNGYRFTTTKYIRLFKYSNTKGGKKVYLYDTEGNLVKEFRTRKEAAKYFGISNYKLEKLLQIGVVDEYKITSIKVDKFVEFKSRRFISNLG
jgi:hypothetical protein